MYKTQTTNHKAQNTNATTSTQRKEQPRAIHTLGVSETTTCLLTNQNLRLLLYPINILITELIANHRSSHTNERVSDGCPSVSQLEDLVPIRLAKMIISQSKIIQIACTQSWPPNSEHLHWTNQRRWIIVLNQSGRCSNVEMLCRGKCEYFFNFSTTCVSWRHDIIIST